MRSRLAKSLVVVTMAVVPTAAFGQANVQVHSETEASTHVDNRNGNPDDDGFTLLSQRLQLRGVSDDYEAFVRLDGHTFFGAETAGYREDLRPERIGLRYSSRYLTVEAGDVNRQLGRGIVLAVRQESALGVDRSIQGGALTLTTRYFDMDAFGGQTNVANRDSISRLYVDDPRDLVVGGRMVARLVGAAELSLFAVYLEPTERVLDNRDFTRSGGVSVELPDIAEHAALYVEVDGQERSLAGAGSRGWAGYGALDVFAGRTSVLVEGLVISDFEMRGSTYTATGQRIDYNQPPTLERVDQEVLDNRDVLGTRLRIEQEIDDWLGMSANGLYRVTSPGEASVHATHGYGGPRLYFDTGSRVGFTFGHRDERQLGRSLKSMTHGELDATQPLVAGWSLHGSYEHQFRRLEQRDYLRGTALLSLERSALGSATAEFGYDTQDPSPGVRNLFAAATLTWSPTQNLKLAATAGTRPGGIRCIAGVCRELPSFAGVQTSLLASF